MSWLREGIFHQEFYFFNWVRDKNLNLERWFNNVNFLTGKLIYYFLADRKCIWYCDIFIYKLTRLSFLIMLCRNLINYNLKSKFQLYTGRIFPKNVGIISVFHLKVSPRFHSFSSRKNDYKVNVDDTGLKM